MLDAMLVSAFARRLRVNGKRMNGAREFVRQRRINHAMAIDPALPFERLRHDIDAEVALAARPVTGVAFMQM